MPAPTVASELYIAVFKYMESLGYSADALYKILNIKSSYDFCVDGRVPLNLYESAMIAAAEISGDNAFGMRMGGAGFPSHMGVYYFLSMTAQNTQQVLDAISKYLPLSFDFVRLETSTSETHLQTVFHYIGRRPHRHVIEYLTAYWYRMSRQMTFDDEKVPRILYLQNAQQCEDHVVQEIFQSTTIHFDQTEDRFDLRLDCLDYHTTFTNENMFCQSESQAINLLMKLRAQDRIANEACHHLQAMLEQGVPGINDVAKKMNCSGRTLQRRLAERNLSYQMLLDYVRKGRAIELLKQTSLPITQIATQTGFADDSTFHRAFRRWTGCSPGSYRHH
jgi:AraC-like DNA-binding protein